MIKYLVNIFLVFIFFQFAFGIEPTELNLKKNNGEVINLKDFSEETLFINFWASWCESCKEEFQTLDQIHKKYGATIKVIAINVDSEEGEFHKALKVLKPSFLNVRCQSGPQCLQQLGGKDKVPYSVLLGPNLEFIAGFLGLKSYAEWERTIKLLGPR